MNQEPMMFISTSSVSMSSLIEERSALLNGVVEVALKVHLSEDALKEAFQEWAGLGLESPMRVISKKSLSYYTSPRDSFICQTHKKIENSS